MYTLFVCGAPHNKKGFELSIIEGDKLVSDECIQFIDKFDDDKMIDGSTYVIQNISCKKKNYLLIENYVSINPSDQKTSRGAYISVGVITDNTLSLSSTINYLCKIVSIQSALGKLRDSRNAFQSNFDMNKDIGKINLTYQDIGFLADLALQHYTKESSKKIVFNDIIHADTAKIDDYAITNQIIKQEKLISKLQEKLQEENEAHQLTIIESREHTQEVESLNLENRELRYKIQNLERQSFTPQRQTDPNELLNIDSSANIHHSAPHRRTQHVPPISKRRRSKTGSSGYMMQIPKKSYSVTGILLLILMVLLVLFGVYFLYIYITDDSTMITPVSIVDKNYSESVAELVEESPKPMDVDASMISTVSKVEEKPKKKASITDKLIELETKK